MIRVGIIGDSGVGKSSIVTALLSPADRNWLYFPTAGCHVSMLSMSGPKLVHFEDESRNPAPEQFFVELWDIGGNLRYRAARKSLLGECEGFIFVWDAETDATFDSLERWLEDVLESTTQRAADEHEDYYGDDFEAARSRQHSVDIPDTPGKATSTGLNSPSNSNPVSPEGDWSPPSSKRHLKRSHRKRTKSNSSTGSCGSNGSATGQGNGSSGGHSHSHGPLQRGSTNKYSSGKLSSIGENGLPVVRHQDSPCLFKTEQNGIMNSTSQIDNSYSNRSMHNRYFIYDEASSGAGKRNRVRGDSLVDHLGIQTPLKATESQKNLTASEKVHSGTRGDGGSDISQRSSYNNLEMMTKMKNGNPSKGGKKERSVFTTGYWQDTVITAGQAVSAAIDSVALVATGAADSVAEAALGVSGPSTSLRTHSDDMHPDDAEEVFLLAGSGSRPGSPDSILYDEESAIGGDLMSHPASMHTLQQSETSKQRLDSESPLDDGFNDIQTGFSESNNNATSGLSGLPLMIVGNKIDKLSARQMDRLRRTCSNHVFVTATSETTPFDPRSFEIFFNEIYARKKKEEGNDFLC
jgi:hypothetical protein